ncbi:MinD/ParA family protein [Mycobacterium sp. M1]|uniref:MinD/ParA family protein n=1 Tax=Mycolicibacter acidiphilus TaxID=2835306 RepID=A0ABS5RGN3_9MYCO|nr:MinD/ParA family protein [Mycolicibacter acidiphilus]MBS9532794.1 MinD/ParA family protein [Mycolicibacter acidiphilus]
MSADYDRLFHAPDADPAEVTSQVNLEDIMRMTQSPAAGGPPMPLDGPSAAPAQPAPTQAAPAQPAPTMPGAANSQRVPWPPTMPQQAAPAPAKHGAPGARHGQPQQLPPPPPQAQPAPAPSHFTGNETGGWQTFQQPQHAQTSATSIGNHRAIDAMSHVGVKTAVKAPSQRGWRHWLWLMTRLNLGLSPDERYEMDLQAQVRRNVRDSYQIAVLGLKGGVGKTSVTVSLGSALAKVRGDRILAIDADPGAGNLAERGGRQSAGTIADLLADREVARYNDIRAHTSMNAANLEILPSDEYSMSARAFNDEDWRRAIEVVSQYYNLVLADCGAGLFDPATQGVLSSASGLVIVASTSIDGARQAAVAMDWLRQNGYQDLLSRACVVINQVVPGKANVDVADLVQQFERHLQPGRVVALPWEKHIATGTQIEFDLLSNTYRRRVLELAAALSEDFERSERRR